MCMIGNSFFVTFFIFATSASEMILKLYYYVMV